MLTRTTTTLLDDLSDQDNQEAWRAFDERYRPILMGFARRLGLQNEDAADAAQETLLRVVKAYRAGKYDRGRGRLHSWIVGIAQNCIIDLQKAQAARREQRGVSAIAELPGEHDLTKLWNAQCEQAILQEAMGLLRAETKTETQTVRAFELVAFSQQLPTVVADELGMSVNEVYLAKHRCLKRLRSIVSDLNAAYELD